MPRVQFTSKEYVVPVSGLAELSRRYDWQLGGD